MSVMRNNTAPMPPSAYRRVAPLIPYLAVIVGMIWLRNAWMAAVGYHLGMAAILALDRGWPRRRTAQSGGRPLHVAAAVLGGLGAGVAIFLLWPLFGVPRGFGSLLARFGLSGASWPLFILYFCAINPWLEEFFWRGYLGAADRTPARHDFFFAGYHVLVMAFFVHWSWAAATLLILASVAWGWRQATRYYDGLLVPIVSHLCADVSIIMAVYWFSRQ